MKRVYDVIRSRWVSLSPEEKVRQFWLHKMVEHLAFPRGLLVVEKELSSLPYLTNRFPRPPSRRIDILSFAKMKKEPYGLCPLLLVECKSTFISSSDLNQVFSYNLFVEAPYVALVNHREVYFCYRAKGEFNRLDSLPSFNSLMESFEC